MSTSDRLVTALADRCRPELAMAPGPDRFIREIESDSK